MTNPVLSEEELKWLKKHKSLVIGNLIDEMNERYRAYANFSFMTPARIDKQVRQDFRGFGAKDSNILFAPPPTVHALPYTLKE